MNTLPTPATLLSAHGLSHGWIRPVPHPDLGVVINGQSVVRYLRFGSEVTVDYLELPTLPAGRWVPTVPTHPAHVTVATLDPATHTWTTVLDVELPRNPHTAGDGLHQGLSIAEMEAVVAKGNGVVHRLELGGLRASVLRVECDREHLVWPNHGESNGAPYAVPFALLDGLKAYGPPPAVAVPPPPAYLPPLRVGSVAPRAPAGMTVEQQPWMVRFSGPQLSIGFSLRRPLLLHLGFDAFSTGRAAQNLLGVAPGGLGPQVCAYSGPVLRLLTAECGPQHWTGAVEVDGARVIYRGLDCGQGVRLDATFTVAADGFTLALTQQVAADLPVLEAEAWRLAWDVSKAMVGAAAVPTLAPGRNGEVALPCNWAGDGNGVLRCSRVSGDPACARLQVESYRVVNRVAGGLVLGPRPALSQCQVLPAGTTQSTWRWEVTSFAPATQPGAPAPSPAVQRYWGAVYCCFRPEYGGFSNNAVSTNCHVNQHAAAELVLATAAPAGGPAPVALSRFTIARALLGGGGYGFWRNLYLDSDPILLATAGRLHQSAPDRAWLASIHPGVTQAARRMLGTIGEHDLVVCRDLSGNSGTHRWSSNAMDVVGFGHLDAYVNAWSYRGLRNAAALLRELGDAPLAAACATAAERLRLAFPRHLLNPATGWVAGWRSRDGELHDAAYLWTNSVACAFGLLPPEQARTALTRLEALRHEVGAGAAHFGLPLNLRPIPTPDHMLPLIAGRFSPTFETYTDGSMGACGVMFYLRALAIYGLHDAARQIAADLEVGYTRGHFNGGVGSGVEFNRWDGLPTGYEGSFVANWAPLYALAIQQGLLTPPDPEWWPQ